jgi:hypothetical protein
VFAVAYFFGVNIAIVILVVYYAKNKNAISIYSRIYVALVIFISYGFLEKC